MKRLATILWLASVAMAYATSAWAQGVPVRDYVVNLENKAVQDYMREVSYTREDTSLVAHYIGEDYWGSLYRPAPVVIDLPECSADSLTVVCTVDDDAAATMTYRVANAGGKASLYNLIPGRHYSYTVSDGEKLLQQGDIETQGSVRMIYVDGTVANVRDLGGWLTEDGKHRLRYGKLIRGSELNWEYEATPLGLQQLRDIGVGAEIDLRAHWEASAKGDTVSEGVSVFGFQNAASTPIGEVPTYLYTNNSGQLPEHMSQYLYQYYWRLEFNFIVQNLREGRAVYYHCIYGRDRTGYLSMLLEGLLGVGYSDIVKDYELSSIGLRSASKKSSFDEALSYIYSMQGETLRDKFERFFIYYIHASRSNIDYFRSAMLEDLPDDDNGDDNGGNEEVSTGISATPMTETKTPVAYDLAGRRVTGMPRSGIYLVRDAEGQLHKTYWK